MQNGAVLGDVNLLAREHSRDPLRKARVRSELEQKLERFIGNPIFRIIELDTGRGGGQTFAAGGIVREKLAQMQLANLLIMRFESLPCGTPNDRTFSGSSLELPAFCLVLNWKMSQATCAFFWIASLLDAITPMSSFHDLTNDFAPSS